MSDEKTNETYSRAQFLEVIDNLGEQDKAIAEAKAHVSSLVRSRTQFRKVGVAALGIPLDVLDEAIRDAAMSGAERDRRYQHKARMMAFLDKPVGFQGFFIIPEDTDEDQAAFAVHSLKAVDAEGYAAGKAGHGRHSSNTYSPGTEAHVRFDSAWLRGNGEIPASAAVAPPEAKRKPGRPRKNGGEVPEANGAAGEPTMSIEDMARRDGRADASEGKDDHEGLYAVEGHAEYLLGRQDIERARQNGEAAAYHG